jgi:sigma-E factor negative regulatory protein RseC
VETEQGIVTRIEARTAWVKTQRSGACQGCSARGSCHGLSDAGKEREVIAVNEAGAAVGDRILLTFESSSLLKVSFLLYVFPILALLVGAMIGQQLGSLIGLSDSVGSAVVGFLAFLVAIWFIKAKANELAQRNEYRPKIIRILERCSPT